MIPFWHLAMVAIIVLSVTGAVSVIYMYPSEPLESAPPPVNHVPAAYVTLNVGFAKFV